MEKWKVCLVFGGGDQKHEMGGGHAGGAAGETEWKIRERAIGMLEPRPH